jgi:hypothetical protein
MVSRVHTCFSILTAYKRLRTSFRLTQILFALSAGKLTNLHLLLVHLLMRVKVAT